MILALTALGFALRGGLGGEHRCILGRWDHGCRGTARGLADGNMANVRCSLRAPPLTISFLSGSVTLAADLYHGAGAAPRPGVVLLHGGSIHGRRLPVIPVLARRFQALGYTVLAPDMRGYGESENPPDPSDPEAFNFALDVRASLDLLDALPSVDRERLYVIGHSFGAGVALAAQADDPRVRKLVLIGPPRRIQERFLDVDAVDTAYVLDRAQRDMRLPSRPSMASWRPVIEALDIERYLDHWSAPGHIPLLLVDSEREDAADRAFLERMYRHIAAPVDYWTVPGTDHYLHTGRLLGRDCYNSAVVSPFAERVDSWLREPHDPAAPGDEPPNRANPRRSPP
jgi:pimeloyl-ACP methyl ester carboxylesterase